jgi:formylglycine-generating enzyme required for sulfatase activity
MTNLDIALPSVEEWMYAARGGEYNETTLYVGDDDANEVAWYGANSGGVVHPSDGRQGKSSNMLDLYDMSGNVSELCNSTYGEDHTQYIICGGNFNSPITEITANSQAPFGVNDKDSTVGFRVIIRVGHLN